MAYLTKTNYQDYDKRMVDTVGDSIPSRGIDQDSQKALQAKKDAVYGPSWRQKLMKMLRIGAATTVLTTAGVSAVKEQSPIQTVQDAASTTQNIAGSVGGEAAKRYDLAMKDLSGQPLVDPTPTNTPPKK